MADEPEEKLLGDVTSDILRSMRANRIAGAVERLTGKPCNCKHRKMKLNELHRKIRAAKSSRAEKIAKALNNEE